MRAIGGPHAIARIGPGTRRAWRAASTHIRRLALASAVATALAGPPAWGHTFPPQHTVVVQVERCELALLVGYTPGTGESTERIVARVASQPKSHALDALRSTLTAYAMAPFAVTLDGAPLVPRSVQAKIGFDAGGTRPTVAVLVTFALPGGGALAITSKDPRTTRISWQDRSFGRVLRARAPTQDHWYRSVASFLLPLAPATGGSACASSASDSSADSSPR